MLNVTKRERETETTGCHNVEILNTLANILEGRSLTELMERKWDGSRDSGV